MPTVPVFYSFHFNNDVMRVQQVRNIGCIDDNKPVSPNEWEEVKKKGDASIQKWIDDNMKYRRCVVVLIGQDTATRPWVKYEIRKAWQDSKGLFGIYIHNLKCPRNGKSQKGRNPFNDFTFTDKSKLQSTIRVYDPNVMDAYGDIARNMDSWVSTAIAQRS
jgi:hypothetical protein